MGLVNSTSIIESTNTTDVKSHLLIVPYAGYKSNKSTKSMHNVTTKSAYTGIKLSCKFVSLKDQTLKKRHVKITTQRIKLVRQDNNYCNT